MGIYETHSKLKKKEPSPHLSLGEEAGKHQMNSEHILFTLQNQYFLLELNASTGMLFLHPHSTLRIIEQLLFGDINSNIALQSKRLCLSSFLIRLTQGETRLLKITELGLVFI